MRFKRVAVYTIILGALALSACTTEEPAPFIPPTGGTAGTMTNMTNNGGMTAGTNIMPTCYDRDLDGFQDATCNPNPNAGGGDCDDTNNLIKPGRMENCANLVDNDCNGQLPATDPACLSGCVDADNDGYQSAACNSDPMTGADCNDEDPRVNPGVMERCGNMIDDDCQGGDLPCLPNCTDNDGDGYGQGAGCLGLDCNDTNEAINPRMSERCGDGVDQDCDGRDLVCPQACTDNDGDGFGVGDGCLGPDCNDANPNINPGAAEVVGDGVDQDCNSRDLIAVTNCTDLDQDGYGQGNGCLGMDCDDSDPRIHEGRLEVCGNGRDDDCSRGDLVCTTIQEGTCIDLDNDGHGEGACLRSSVDCDDSNPDINPFAEEVCNGVDDNCNGEIDECAGRNQVCSANGLCVGRVGSPCQQDIECLQELGLICDADSGQCRVGPGNECVADEDCVASSECLEISGCGAGRRCYQRQGNSCADACDCTGALVCNDLNDVCVECDGRCSGAGELCTEGGFCVTDSEIGWNNDIRLEFLELLVECYQSYRGFPEAQGCARTLLDDELYDGEGNVLPNIPSADTMEDYVCDDGFFASGVTDVVAMYFSPTQQETLVELFGCGLTDVWNIFWERDLLPGDEVCIYYTPSKGGFSLPPFRRTEVVVVGQCNISVVD
jgi:hypothetical protein